jgi:TRAP-type C4-dicarboxylate transport system permease small subunit
VINRFFIGASLKGVVELEEYLMVVIVFLSLGYVQRQEGHIHIDLLTCKLPDWLTRCLNTFNLAAASVFFIIMCWRTLITMMTKSSEYSPMLSIPLWFGLGLAVIGVAILALVLLQQLLRSIAANLEDHAAMGMFIALVGAVLLITMPCGSRRST